VKRDIEHQEAEVDQYYADLWAQDIAVKGAREAQETEKRAAFNADLQHSQIRQMEGVEDLRQRGLKLKAEQQRLRLEEAALMEDERIRTLNNKRMAQDRFRRTLDRDAELRATHASTNMNEEMQSDLDLLNRIEAGQKQVRSIHEVVLVYTARLLLLPRLYPHSRRGSRNVALFRPFSL
jgi:hypothetical protein